MKYHETEHGVLYNGESLEVLRTLPDNSVNCCVTSPPYWGLRDYGVDGQLGLERTPEEYVSNMVKLFREVRRVLKKDGTLWLNLGDSYAGSGAHAEHHANPGISQAAKRGCKQGVPVVSGLKPKDLVGIPWRVAFALQADGWYLRQDIIWHKPNPMPESVTDRCTKSHEYVFLMSKSAKYYCDNEAIKENSTTFENRPSGVERNRLYGYDSKENNNPQAYLKNIKGNISERGVTRTTEGLNLGIAITRTTDQEEMFTMVAILSREETTNTSPLQDLTTAD